MSCWTNINGTIKLMVYGSTQAQKDYILQTVLNHLPVVSGSEGDMEVHIVKRYGHNGSCSADEYNQVTNNLTDRYGTHTRKRGWLHTQDIYFLMIDGYLRDTQFNEVFREFIKWLTRLSKRIIVTDVFVKIQDDYGKGTILNDTQHFYDMFECFNWKDNEESNWTEHLFWQIHNKNAGQYAIL